MDGIYRVLKFVVVAFTCALVIIVGGAAFFRYVLHQSLHWATEAPNFLFMWIVFLGAAIAYRDKKHIAFAIFVEKLPPKIRDFIEMIGTITLAAFFAFLFITGCKVVSINIASETEALKIPYGLVYASVPIASLLMFLDSLGQIWMKVMRGK